MRLIKGFTEFLFEGGKAIHGSRRLSQGEARALIAEVRKKLVPKVGTGRVMEMGSAGHKPEGETSGDVDLGVEGMDLEKAEKAVRAMGMDCVLNRGLGVLSVAWPLDDGLAQVDLIPVRHWAWSEFVYAPVDPKHTAYKSAHRNWLLCAALACRRDEVETGDDGAETWRAYSMRLNDGLYRVRKTEVGKSGRRVKHARKLEEEFVTADPKRLLRIALGDDVRPEDARTFEQCWKAVRLDGSLDLGEVAKKLREFLKRAGLDLPSEIKNIP